MDLTILHRDEHVLAVVKPAGMLVHRSAIDRSAHVNVLDLLRTQLRCPLHLLHRLDRPVGGVLLLALHADAARAMSAAFERSAVRKTYLAVVRGHAPEAGVIDHALRETRDPATDARARSGKAAQPALTDYERLATVELPLPVGPHPTARFSLMRLRPHTGRRHQLRRHLKHIAHPILGDTTHGDGRQNAFARAQLGCERLLLFARGVEFAHPASGQLVRIAAPVDRHFSGVMQALGWEMRLVDALAMTGRPARAGMHVDRQ